MKDVIRFTVDGIVAIAIVKGVQMYGKHQYNKGYSDGANMVAKEVIDILNDKK